ncbi:TMV resistance protein N isoform X3 [Pyrus x bretschneideri]|uniref:TMV resistance protein N isoform X3 n=1 Tax=Pyrus x bretschneideri TaxID=225117 RepID=UPI002030A887|nr:TMV resistance protein N isoform X3 [Pyrus x bretschneideri]
MTMEITSTSFPFPTQWKYDVFLSFRGDDTRKGFTDHLYSALERHGILTFKDDPELQKGKSISPELFSAIQESRFALIVLSKNYASSTWCLDELLKILECMEARKTVLPIFYEVDPSDVRKQKGSFAEAFTKHEENLKNDLMKVQSWRDALTTVANLSGWDSKNWYESKLIKDIVELVWKKLRPTLSSHVEGLVGMESRLKPINFFLSERVDDVCFIGIWGMGGIGKTTIARVVYERISHEFEFSIFLDNVRDNVAKTGILHLQKQLLSKIGMEIDYIWSVSEGIKMIKRFLHHKKVLLILDDVNHLDQLEHLAGNRGWFGSGSVVLITTRDEHLLITHGVDRTFEVQGLSDDEALLLFSWKAFKRDYPEQSYVGMCNHVVNYAKGLPLAVKVLGSFLHGRDLSAWTSALDKLREVCNSDVLETLKISYDDLEHDEQRIFLDIACFFNLKDKNRVRETLDACGFYAEIGLAVLVEKSLLTISDGIMSMHDLLQEMGREIVRRESPDDPGRRSRLWRREDVDQVLRKNTGQETIEGIMVHPFELELVTANARSFLMMNKLRYLKLNNVVLSNGLDYLPNSLRILEWPEFPLKSLPSSFSPEDLLELNLHHSRFKHIKPISSLKTIDLSHSLSLVQTPDFRDIPFLERLILEGCIQLYEVDSSAGMLGRLTLMNLKDCKNLVRLPKSVCGLKSLKILNVCGCSKLEKLPEDLGHIEGLEELDVGGTAIREPPASIGCFKNLKVLSFRGCKVPSSKPWNITLFPFWPRQSLKA